MTTLRLAEAIGRSKRSELEFFQEAYLWAFKKMHNCVSDLCQWKQHGIVPKYVLKYLDHVFG